MKNHEEWNEFLDNLLSSAITEHKNSREYEHQQKRMEQIDEMLTTNLTEDQKFFIDEILFELLLIAERETEVVYRQGLRDGVWMLKNLGVLL